MQSRELVTCLLYVCGYLYPCIRKYTGLHLLQRKKFEPPRDLKPVFEEFFAINNFSMYT